MALGTYGWFDCGCDGPTHMHRTQAELDACLSEFSAYAEREAERLGFPEAVVMERFFADSGSTHLETWAGER